VVKHVDHPGSTVYIELECGKDQKQWVSSIHDNRARWVYGLNVLSRKVSEGQHYHVFIKHNAEGNSFFACTYGFVKQYGKLHPLARHSLQFVTDSVVYAIPWQFVDQPNPVQNQFCTDNPLHLKALIKACFQPICVCSVPSTPDCNVEISDVKDLNSGVVANHAKIDSS
jgi:hypothetical protein